MPRFDFRSPGGSTRNLLNLNTGCLKFYPKRFNVKGRKSDITSCHTLHTYALISKPKLKDGQKTRRCLLPVCLPERKNK